MKKKYLGIAAILIVALVLVFVLWPDAEPKNKPSGPEQPAQNTTDHSTDFSQTEPDVALTPGEDNPTGETNPSESKPELTEKEARAKQQEAMAAVADRLGYTEPNEENFGLPVFSVWAGEDFIGEESGIYYHMNFFSERRRVLVFTEVYNKKGELKSSAYTETTMHGGASMGLPMKSFRLYYDDDLGDLTGVTNPKKLYYNLFNDQATDVYGEAIHSFRHILLRNAGNDNNGGMLRDLLAAKICIGMKADVAAGQPVMVYINGTRWGLYNARERLDRRYFADHYDIAKDDVVIIDTPSPYQDVDKTVFALSSGTPGDEDTFNEVLKYVQEHSATDETLAYVEEYINLESLIDTLCANSFAGNGDWGNNNVRVWRNKGTKVTTVDNRWNFVIKDLDYGLGLSTDPSCEVLDNMQGSDAPFAQFVTKLMQNDAFMTRLLDRYEELLKTNFAYSNTLPLLQGLSGEIREAVKFNIERWGAPASYSDWEKHITQIQNFLKKRVSRAQSWIDKKRG